MKKPSKKFWRHTPAPRTASRSFFWHRRLIGKSRASETPPLTIGATDTQPPQEQPRLMERVWQWIHTTFPERQIYIRSDGRVQFFTFGPSLQATLAGLVLIFLGWVAFATVNVVFKDRIIAAKDHRYQQMQAAYENRVADLQTSYDELNAALVSAQDHFRATADVLQTKQNAIAGFLNRASQVQASLGGRLPATPSLRTAASPNSQSLSANPPAGGEDTDSSQLIMMPGPAQPQPRTSKPVKSSLLDGMFRRVTALFDSTGQRQHAAPRRENATTYAQHPGLKFLARQIQRIARIGESENLLMAKTEGTLGQGVGNLRNVMRRTGINPDSFARKVAGAHGIGGPEIPLNQVRIEGISDPNFSQAYLSASAVLDQLNGLSAALDHVPLAAPVSVASFDKSSGFGARIDPFTGRYAFHPGIDFAGPWGSVVHATAPGTVLFAGRRGGYGNMVEVDHGYGIHTRYGHLSTISVRIGTQVGKGAGLGRVGSTGRSTGPHVHYEVWYDDVVKNPNNFIEAGRNVL
jgi:murein DD-endopeptidase MepM/ murein hydrolase activator NlpD